MNQIFCDSGGTASRRLLSSPSLSFSDISDKSLHVRLCFYPPSLCHPSLHSLLSLVLLLPHQRQKRIVVNQLREDLTLFMPRFHYVLPAQLDLSQLPGTIPGGLFHYRIVPGRHSDAVCKYFLARDTADVKNRMNGASNTVTVSTSKSKQQT